MKYIEKFERYLRAVECGCPVTEYCKEIRFSVRRQRRDMERKRFAYSFVPENVEKACAWIEKLPLVEGQWDTISVRLDDFQVFFIGLLFGWVRKESPDIRRYTVAYFEVARKNRKSSTIAMVAAYVFCEMGLSDPGCKVLCCANTEEQANLVFHPIHALFQRDNSLRSEYNIHLVKEYIGKRDDENARVKRLSSNARVQDGHNPSLAIVDEIHGFEDSALWEVLVSGTGARKNSLIVGLTTAGHRVSGPYQEMHERAKACLSGTKADHEFLPIIYRVPAARKRACLLGGEYDALANPVLLSRSKLSRILLKRAIDGGRRNAGLNAWSRAEFWRKRCNISVQDEDCYFDSLAWEKRCVKSGLRANLLDMDLSETEVYAGFDKASNDDLTAFVLVYRATIPRMGDKIIVEPYFFLPEDTLESRMIAHDNDYMRFQAAGDLIATPGAEIQDIHMIGEISRICMRRSVKKICYDPYMSDIFIGHLQNTIMQKGDDADVVPEVWRFPQTTKLYNEPILGIKREIANGRIACDNSVMDWNIGNFIVYQDTNRCVRPDKRYGKHKIDGAVAMVMAYAWLVRDEMEMSGFEGDRAYQCV